MGVEKKFEEKVKAFLKEQGAWVIKYWGGGGFTRAGVPDILACYKGVFLGVELKAPKGKPSALQLRELHRIRDSGGFAVLLYPKDLGLFESMVRAIGDGRWELAMECRKQFEERMKKYEQDCG